MDVLNRKGRYDSLLALRAAGNQSGTLVGTALDMGSSTKSSFCMVNINSITGEDSPSLVLLLEGSNDGVQWDAVSGMQINAAGLFRLALGDRGYRYWRYNAQCFGTNPVVNWSAFLTAE